MSHSQHREQAFSLTSMLYNLGDTLSKASMGTYRKSRRGTLISTAPLEEYILYISFIFLFSFCGIVHK